MANVNKTHFKAILDRPGIMKYITWKSSLKGRLPERSFEAVIRVGMAYSNIAILISDRTDAMNEM